MLPDNFEQSSNIALASSILSGRFGAFTSSLQSLNILLASVTLNGMSGASTILLQYANII